jgi:hypothetical protein
MKQYLERYIHDVTRRLPESIKEEVKKELENNIKDMLSENPTDEEIENVLKELGHPKMLAMQYKEKPSYVVSPIFYDEYVMVLKIVMVIFAVVAMITGSIEVAFDQDAVGFTQIIANIFSKIIGNVFSGLLSAFAWVTIIFWAISHHASKNNDPCKWELKDLPELPKPTSSKISRSSTIVELCFQVVFSLVFIIVLMRYMDVVAIYVNGEMITPIFNQQITTPFIPFYIISLALFIVSGLIKIYYGRWNLQVAFLHSAAEILSLTIGLILINNSQLILYDAYVAMADVFGITTTRLQSIVQINIKWITILGIVGISIGVISTFYKALKHQIKKTTHRL